MNAPKLKITIELWVNDSDDASFLLQGIQNQIQHTKQKLEDLNDFSTLEDGKNLTGYKYYVAQVDPEKWEDQFGDNI